MSKRKWTFLLVCALALSMLAACGTSVEPVVSTVGSVQTGAGTEATAAEAAAADPVAVTDAGAESDGGGEIAAADSSVAATVENSEDHGDPEDYIWDSSEAIQIALEGDSITASGASVTVDGSQVTIVSAGTYIISGSLADGQIIVNTGDEGMVRLILNGVDISSSTSAPIYVMAAQEAMIVLADNTDNYVSDGDSYVLQDPEADEPNAAIFSKADLTIYGSGSLTVDGNCNDGIASKDGLIIAGGTIVVNSVDDGIRGKDYLVVQDGNITVTAQSDGLKSDNEEDATKGYVLIEKGVINITSGGDAIEAQTDVMIAGGEIALSAGGGSNASIDETASAKGIRGVVSVNINSGTFTIDSADDAIHSNGTLTINGGTFVVSTGDDAIHADSTLEVNGGEVRITDSYEGLESALITINDGDIHIISSDDGLNVASGVDGSGMQGGPGLGGRPGQDNFIYSGDNYLYINGGYIVVESAGDGIDVNGAIEMTDGVVIVNGPTEQMNGAVDYDASFKISGGVLVAAGSSDMAMAPSESSTQCSVLLYFDSTQWADTLVHIQTNDGDEILTFSPTKEYQSLAFSSPEFVDGSAYDVYLGGSSTGTATDGLYQDGTYTPGTGYTSFTISGIQTRIGGNFR